MHVEWLAAFALGAGHATPSSPEAVLTLMDAADNDVDTLLRSRVAIESLATIPGDTREEALHLVDLAVARLQHPARRSRLRTKSVA